MSNNLNGKTSRTYLDALNSLNENQRGSFEKMCRDYLHCVQVIHGGNFYSPRVLSEMVRMGWTHPDDKKETAQ